MNASTSIGPGPGKGGNQDTGNADGRGNKTLGEHEMPEPEIGAEEPSQEIPQPSQHPRILPDR